MRSRGFLGQGSFTPSARRSASAGGRLATPAANSPTTSPTAYSRNCTATCSPRGGCGRASAYLANFGRHGPLVVARAVWNQEHARFRCSLLPAVLAGRGRHRLTATERLLAGSRGAGDRRHRRSPEYRAKYRIRPRTSVALLQPAAAASDTRPRPVRRGGGRARICPSRRLRVSYEYRATSWTAPTGCT